jgi:hypothetical protein
VLQASKCELLMTDSFGFSDNLLSADGGWNTLETVVDVTRAPKSLARGAT